MSDLVEMNSNQILIKTNDSQYSMIKL